MNDVLGYAASALVLAAFAARDMLALRLQAIPTNAAFIAYAWAAGLKPVLVLHLLLLPMNALRLAQLRRRPSCGCVPPCAPPAAAAGQRAPALARFRVRP